MAKTAWGIELGTSSVKAVKLSGDSRSASLEDVSIISLADFGLGTGTSQLDATAGALNELRGSKGIGKGDEVYVSISGQNTLGRIISLPPVGKERVRETIENEARSQIPIKLEEAVWDFQIIEDDDPDELRVNLYAAKKDVVDEIIDTCDAAGLQITGVQVAPLGIYNYIKYEMDDAVSDACVAIDIGAENTDVIIIDGQKTYVRVVPVAGNDITKALRARFKLQIDDAEKLKRRAHKSKDAAAVFEAMKPPLKDMVGEIYRAVGFYKSQHEEANINQLVMMGNGSKLLNIKKFFEQQLQYQVHKVDTPVRVALSRSVDPTEVQNNIQSLTVAIGLALQGLGLDEVNTINLIPPEYIERQETAKLQVPFYVGGALAAAGGLIALLIAIFSTGGIDTVTGTATSAVEQANNQSSQYQEQLPDESDTHKALSLINLTEGVVGTWTPPSDDDEEATAAGRDFRILVNQAPGMMAKAVQDALAEYLSDKPETDIFYANIKNPQGGLPSNNNSAAVMVGSVTRDWRGDSEGEGGYYVAERTFSYDVRVASLLTPSTSEDEAHDALRRELANAKDGLLVVKLREAVMAYLEASGQLEGLDEKQINKLAFENITVAVDQRSALSDFNSEKYELANIVPVTDVMINGRTPFGGIGPGNESKFGVSDIRVKIKLDMVKASDEEEEDTGDE